MCESQRQKKKTPRNARLSLSLSEGERLKDDSNRNIERDTHTEQEKKNQSLAKKRKTDNVLVVIYRTHRLFFRYTSECYFFFFLYFFFVLFNNCKMQRVLLHAVKTYVFDLCQTQKGKRKCFCFHYLKVFPLTKFHFFCVLFRRVFIFNNFARRLMSNNI